VRGRLSYPDGTIGISTQPQGEAMIDPSGGSGGSASPRSRAHPRLWPWRAGGPPSRIRRRITAALRLVAALALFGWLYTAFAPGVQAADDTQPMSAAAQKGKQIYDISCISCHGRNAQGVEGRGPSLIGVGSAAVEFQVTTGRMPGAFQGAQQDRKPAKYGAVEAQQIGAFIEELGGGPQLPGGDNLAAQGDEAISRGGALFRINCSSCHAFSTNGGALSSGKTAPTLRESTDRQIWAAMLTGPENMPVFGDNQLTPQEKADIIAYIQNLKSDQDPGGWGMGRYGPVPEAIAIFLVGVVALVFTSLWIAGKS
jgi:ubiquinol-cytochrome c reductase cytochrome c subunit